MLVVALAAGRSLSVAQLDEVTSTLRAATEEPVEMDLFSWSPVEAGAPVRTARVLGPVTTYRPPSPASSPAAAAPPSPPSQRAEAAEPLLVSASPVVVPEQRSPGRRALGRAHWGLRRALVGFRRGETYRRVRRAVRGDISRQFAAAARRNRELADAVREADVVIALDQNAIPAAWRISRTVTGPAVVNGVAAGQRVLASPVRASAVT